MKNALLRGLVYLLQPPKDNPAAEEKRFLVVSTTALGDTLWATPAIRALRVSHPTSTITVLTSPVGKQVLTANPYIDALFVLDNPALYSLKKLYGPLKKQRFSHIFIFHTSQRPVLPFAAVLGAPHIIGSEGINKGLDNLLTRCFPRDLKMHEIERRLKMLTAVDASPSGYEMDLFLQKEDEEAAEHLSFTKPIIALHPGSKDAFRRWPASHFIQLGKRLVADLPCTLLITGVPSEKDLVKSIAKEIEGAIAVTDLPLRPFAALIKKARLIVTNDTGPMHIALAVKTPLLALFSPSDPERFGPYRVQKAIAIAKKAPCTPCLTRKCPSSFCFLQIGVQEVYDAALKLYEDS